VDRGGALFLTLFYSQVCIVIPIWMLIESVNSYPEILALAAIPAAVLAAARALWESSTRSVRQRTATLLEVLREAAGQAPDGGAQGGADLTRPAE
jgi:hypothetical protein